MFNVVKKIICWPWRTFRISQTRDAMSLAWVLLAHTTQLRCLHCCFQQAWRHSFCSYGRDRKNSPLEELETCRIFRRGWLHVFVRRLCQHRSPNWIVLILPGAPPPSCLIPGDSVSTHPYCVGYSRWYRATEEEEEEITGVGVSKNPCHNVIQHSKQLTSCI